MRTLHNKISWLDADVVNEPIAFQRAFAGKYQFVSEIGCGGMGIIYKAKQPLLDRYYAIKMLNVKRANEQMLARFHQEAKAASTLNHPNVISVHDFGFTEDDDPYMVMDFVDGMSLSNLILTSGSIHYKEALPIFLQIADGMNHAHISGVLHRDLKPSNVMLVNPESLDTEVKIVDFGIAKINKAAESSSLTQTGDVFGSPLYMSPEQISGKKVDSRSDIYSLGCLMFEALTGAPPLQADTIIQTMFLHLNEVPQLMTEKVPCILVPESLEYVVQKCLAKNPDLRYQTMLELKMDLVKVATARPIKAKETAVRRRTSTASSKIKWTQILVGFLVFASALYTIYERQEISDVAERREAQARSTEQKFNTDLQGDSSKPLSGIDAEAIAMQEVALNKSAINFPAMSADDAALIYLEGNPNIVSLSMHANVITPNGFTHLKFPNLEILDVQESEMSPELITAIVNLPKLKSLNLAKIRYSQSDLLQISKLDNLRSLNLSRSNLTDDDCKLIARMHRLEQLRIGVNPQISDKGVSALNSLKNLRSLGLNNTGVTDKGIATLKSLPHLTDLVLYETHISDASVKILSKMPLKKLYLTDTYISSLSIKPLSKMSSLNQLEIDRNPRLPVKEQYFLESALRQQGAIVKIDRVYQR